MFTALFRRLAFASIAPWLMLASPLVAQTPDAGLRGHGGPIRAMAVLPDGRVTSAGFDGAIIIWDVNAGRAERVLRFHDTAVNALLARPDACLVSGGEDGRIAVWCGTEAKPSQMLAGHEGPVSALAVAPDGRLMSGGFDGWVRVWAPDGTAHTRTKHQAPVTSIVSGNNGALLSASQDGSVFLSAAGEASRTYTLKLPASVNGAASLRDGHLLLACADGRLREVDGQLKIVHEIELPDGPLTTVAVSPDGQTIATAGMRTPVTLIDATSGEVKSRILGPGLPIWALAFSLDSRALYTGGADRAVRQFDVATGTAIGATISPPSKSELPEPKDRGAQVFRACVACHGLTAADTNLAGPTLHGIMGRRIASAPGYAFSDPLKKLDIVWTPETIAKLFEVGPTLYTPGTKMPEQRITDPADRQALVDWLARVTTR
jgi:cytochrome c